MSTKGKALLSGNVYCGHCGTRIVSTMHTDSGSWQFGKMPRVRYVCYHNTRRLNNCDGQGTYTDEKVDAIIIDLVKLMFSKLSDIPQKYAMEARYKSKV